MAENTYDAEAIIQAINGSSTAIVDAITGTGGSVIGVSVTNVPVGPGPSPWTLAVFNSARNVCIIQNTGSTLYVKLGTGASLTNYSFRMSPTAYASIDKWQGAVSAVRESTTDIAIVTETF